MDRDYLESEISNLYFLKTSILKYTTYLVLSILTIGLFPLIISWTESLKYWVVFKVTRHKYANYVLIKTTDDILVLCKLQSILINKQRIRFITFRFVKYFLNEND